MPYLELPDGRKFKRIFLCAVTGSGKTTLAQKLSEISGIPWQEVDQLTWLPDWKEVSHEEQRNIFTKICEGEEWILDTAYGKWVDIPLAKADLLIGLDYPRWVSLNRLLKRSIRRAFSKQPICNGNHETLGKLFSQNSIILWHFRSVKSKRRRLDHLAKINSLTLIRLKSPKETEEFLASLKPL